MFIHKPYYQGGFLQLKTNAGRLFSGTKKGDITSLNQLGILGELFSEFAFALHQIRPNA